MRRRSTRRGTEMVTVALRRVDLDATGGPDILEFIDSDAVPAAAEHLRRRRRRGGGPAGAPGASRRAADWIKLEVTPDPRYLLPDPVETLRGRRAAGAPTGFTVLPYINADPVLAKRLEEAGCATVMPLGSWIGSNQGVRTRDADPDHRRAGHRARGRRRRASGRRRHAAEAMELGADAVLVNTAIAIAGDPAGMAAAFAAGRRGRAAGRSWPAVRAERGSAEASSPLTGFLERLHTLRRPIRR